LAGSTTTTTIDPDVLAALPVEYVPTAADRVAGGRSGLALLCLVVLVGLLLVSTTTRTLGLDRAGSAGAKKAEGVVLATTLISDVADVSWSLLDVDPVTKPDDGAP
jgi:hypothetical protein